MSPWKDGWSLVRSFDDRKSVRAFAFAVVALLPSGWAWAAGEVPFYCPALHYHGGPPLTDTDDLIINGSLRLRRFPPSLIALGTGTLVERGAAFRPARYRLDIEDVLYGDRSLKSVEFYGPFESNRRAIFTLCPTGTMNGPEYEEDGTTEADDLPSAQALATARFAELVLNAESIFIGEEVNDNRAIGRISAPPPIRVRMLANLAGAKYPENGSILVADSPRSYPGRQLYFLQKNPDPRTHGAMRWLATLPLTSQDEVLETLKARETHPLVDDPEDRYHPHYREIVFQGTIDQAMALYSSWNSQAAVLGLRYFMHHRTEARPRLVKQIESALWQTVTPKEIDSFSAQQSCIHALGLLERKETTGALGLLIEKLIANVEASPEPVPIPESPFPRSERIYPTEHEERYVYFNHTLTWLLMELPEEEAVRRWGDRLLALKTHLTGWWQKEAELAVNVLRLESVPELKAALARMKAITPVRSVAGLYPATTRPRRDPTGVYFSADHRRLWSFAKDSTICHWDAETMKLIDRKRPRAGSEFLSVAEPRGEYALYADGRWTDSVSPVKVSVIASESGKIMTSMELPISSHTTYHWLSGGQLLAVDLETITLVDVVQGKILREASCREHWTPYYLSMDRVVAVGGFSGKGQEYVEDKLDLTTGAVSPVDAGQLLQIETLDGVAYEHLDSERQQRRPKKVPEVRGFQVLEPVKSPDGRRLAIVTGGRISRDGRTEEPDPKSSAVVRIHDVETLRMLGAIPSSSLGVMARFSADGTQLVLVQEDGSFERWALPP